METVTEHLHPMSVHLVLSEKHFMEELGLKPLGFQLGFPLGRRGSYQKELVCLQWDRPLAGEKGITASLPS